MKKLILSALLVTVATSAFAAVGIKDSKHNLASAGSDQTCKFCHVPHGGAASVPLWARSTAILSSTGVYNSDSFDGGTLVVGPMNAQSSACFACHNVNASDSTGYGGVADLPAMPAATKLTLDLSNDHPVGFLYSNSETADPAGLVAEASIGLPLYAGSMECATCHAVHGVPGKTDSATIMPKFLRTTNTNSGLCLKCHIK